MEFQNLSVFRIELADVILGTVFLFFGLASCAVAALRKRSEVRVLVWLGFWSGMYGANLLFRAPAVRDALPLVLQSLVSFARNAFGFLTLVAGLLVWADLTLGKMRRLTQILAALASAVAIGGIAEFALTGQNSLFLPWNNLLAVAALISLGTVLLAPGFAVRFLAFPNRILVVSTVVFTADALFRNGSRSLFGEPVQVPLIVNDLVFALFLFSFAWVAGQKVFTNERRLLAIDSELEIARQIQASILPTASPEIENLRIAARYLPMTAIGGDFYEFIPVDPHRAGFLVADVSGHGVPAALISTMLKVAVQSVAAVAHEPAQVLRGLNRILSPQLRGQLISAAYLFVNTQASTALYSSAGHPPLLRFRGDTLEQIESNGLLFGVLADSEYPVCEMPLSPGDRFLLYTDGVVEPENAAGESFGDNALEQAIRANRHHPPAEFSDHLLAGLRRWQPASTPQQDDITLLVIDVV